MSRLIKHISVLLAAAVIAPFIGFQVPVSAADDIRFDFTNGTEGGVPGSQTTATATAEDGVCILTTNETDLSSKNIRLTLPELDLGNGGYYMYVKARYELPEELEMAYVYCMDANKQMSEMIPGSWAGYETKKVDITGLKGKQTLSVSFQTKKESITGVGYIYIDWVVLSQSPNPPKVSADGSAGYTEMYTNSDSKAVRLLVSLDIMDYDTNTDLFWNDTPMKRRQMADLLCRLFGLKKEKASERMFDDVSDEDRAAVETVVKNGYMSGYSNSLFGAEDYVTGNQIIKIYVTLLGGQAVAENLGGFPYGYYEMGNRLGLKKTSYYMVNNPVTRLDVANAIYDAMHADYLEISGFSGRDITYRLSEEDTFMSKLGIYKAEGIMTADDVTNLTSPGGAGNNGVIIQDRTINDPKNITSGFLGYNVVAYEKRAEKDMTGDIIYIEQAKKNSVMNFDSVNVVVDSVDGSRVSYYEGTRERKVTLSTAVDMIYNGVAIDYSADTLVSDSNDEIKFVDNDDDGKYDVVFVYDYNDYVVSKVRAEDMQIALRYNEPLLDIDDAVVRIYSDDKPASIEDIFEEQVISVAKSENTSGKTLYTIKIGIEPISGSVTLTGKDGNKRTANIDGTEYYMSDYAEELISKGYISDLKSGENGSFTRNAWGHIVSYSLSDIEKVAYIAGFKYGENDAHDPALFITLYTQDGELRRYTVTDDIKVDDKKMSVENITSNISILSSFDKRQLIKVKFNGDKISSVKFAQNRYNAAEFSKDVSLSTLPYRRRMLFDDRFKLDSGTMIFRAPVKSISNISAETEVYSDEGLYSIEPVSVFEVDKSYSVELYDVQPNGTVKYIFSPYEPTASQIVNTTQLLLITDVSYEKDEDNEDRYCVYGYSEKAAKQKFFAAEDESIYESSLERILARGDVIQYKLDNKGRIRQFKLCHAYNADETDYITAGIGFVSSKAYIQSYGIVGFVDGNQLGLYNSEPTDSPMDCSLLVTDAGSTVYSYNRSRKKFDIISFSEINVGDELFAVLNKSNVPRMLVVYK